MPLGGEKKETEGASAKRCEAQDCEKSNYRCVCQRGSDSRFYLDLYCGTLRFSGQNFVRVTDGSGILVNPKCVSEIEDQELLLLRFVLRNIEVVLDRQ